MILADLGYLVFGFFAGEFVFDEFFELWVHGCRVRLIGVFVVLCCLPVDRVSMSVEKNFQRRSWTFQFVFWALFLFLIDVLFLSGRVLAWCSMLLCVTFNVGMRGFGVC